MNTINQILKNKEIRNKFLFTILCITIFRIGATIPLPIIKLDAMKDMLEMNSFYAMYEMFSGGTFSQVSIFTLGITPYITASIIMNLLSFAIPKLEDLSQEGEIGKRKMKRYTILLGLFIALVQGIGVTVGRFGPYLINDSFVLKALTVGILVLGVYLLTVIDKKIEKHGIGKGASIIICSSILAKLPSNLKSIQSLVKNGNLKIEILVLLLIGLLLLIALVVQVQEATRKVQINYAKHSACDEIQLDSSYLPLKINQTSITPIIFAQTLLTLPQMAAILFPKAEGISKAVNALNGNVVLFNLLLAGLIIFFNYFYLTVAFDVDKIADNLKKAHGFITDVRPGEETANYLRIIMKNLMVIGNLFLIFVALMPTTINSVISINTTLIGTSLLIVTSTFIDIFKQTTAQISAGKNRAFFELKKVS